MNTIGKDHVLTLLGEKEVEAALEGDALARPLIVGGEPGGVRGLGDLAVDNLLQGVQTVARLVESVHQMHLEVGV